MFLAGSPAATDAIVAQLGAAPRFAELAPSVAAATLKQWLDGDCFVFDEREAVCADLQPASGRLHR